MEKSRSPPYHVHWATGLAFAWEEWFAKCRPRRLVPLYLIFRWDADPNMPHHEVFVDRRQHRRDLVDADEAKRSDPAGSSRLTAPKRNPTQTRRFLAKRELILDAASALINERGVRGLSLAEVGEILDLSSTSITYYFKRREDLAASCFGRALDRLAEQVEMAGREATVASRLARLVDLTFGTLEGGSSGDPRTVVRLSDLRAVDDPMRGHLIGRFIETFRRARAFFGEGGDEEAALSRMIRTHVMLDTLFTLPSWLPRYEGGEYPRVQRRLLDILSGGLAPSASWRPAEFSPIPDAAGGGGERFLDVTTRLVNKLGYRGASVDRISAELGVTKGSFYHHLDAKDNLVLECFRRSFATVSSAQAVGSAVGGDHLLRLTTTLAILLDLQLSDRMPLLRSTALLALPADLRSQAIAWGDRITLSISGTIIDGITEESLASVDPIIAGQMLMSSVNAAFELRERARRIPLTRAVALYGTALLHGVADAI